ncbi:hypothetical protein ACH4Y0_02405 [Streptomyces sp. NPDC020707]|uniref:hypothetical protein n=1 Tax=Streptomyces sp. NPDC020707 TaxID=3365084 RepID=UPI0037B6406C
MTSSLETQEWDPLPAIGKFSAKTAVRSTVSFVVLHLILLPIVVAAAHATDGYVHLVLGLVAVSMFMAIAQSAGALLARHGKSATVPLALTAKIWLVVPVLALWPLLDLAGVSDDDRQPMMAGVALGLVFNMAIWVGWALIARRYPGIKYHPGRLKRKRWYLRVTLNIAGLIGGLAWIGLRNM